MVRLLRMCESMAISPANLFQIDFKTADPTCYEIVNQRANYESDATDEAIHDGHDDNGPNTAAKSDQVRISVGTGGRFSRVTCGRREDGSAEPGDSTLAGVILKRSSDHMRNEV